ncbi:4Fe-4S binding protein [Desulfopila sp. IMCC35008]|uniref:4Fe-4S binding protein n=1 Tax=Desulfopila sp. IMCC35008 TaxID=2653858 RepID=UPI0013D15C0F|nr:4Fe-4S binding protein [Desulfopila sp. IMCC35008]
MKPNGHPERQLPNGNNVNKHKGYSGLRLIVLFCAFLVVLVNPFINFYLHNNFIQGWYQSIGIGSLWFVSPLEGLESLLITKSIYMPSIIGMVIPFTIALLLGRVFCSWICPVTFFLELTDRLRKKISKHEKLRNRLVVAKWVLWFTLTAELVTSMVLGKPIFVFLSPPGLVGREIMMLVFFGSMAFEGVLLIAILLLEFVTRRFFCRTFCPLGALLAFIGRKRKLIVEFLPENCTGCRKCERSCPMGLVPQKDEGRSAFCWNCGECIDSCGENSLKLSWQNP